MDLHVLIICTYLFVAITLKVSSDTIPSSEDLVDEYYTTILNVTSNYLPEDEKDAQAIIDSDRKEEVIAGILSYRDKIRRFAIQQRMLTKIDPEHSYIRIRIYLIQEVDGAFEISPRFCKYTVLTHQYVFSIKNALQTSGKQSHTTYYWVSESYDPQRNLNSTSTFIDLCFGLLKNENVVLSQYLNNFFFVNDETRIIIGMILTKDMGAMITTFDKIPHAYSFKETRKFQRHPFENMLRVWVRHSRDLIDIIEPNKDDVKKDADTLKSEYDSGSWHEKNRDQLELILMKKSFKYARAVIAEFETAMGGKKLEDIINDCVHSDIKLNHDLADAYASLARYIKDKYSYIADILRTYSDGNDFWAAWIMCIAVVHPQEWPKVDQAFQKDPKDGSLSKFILQKLTTDKVMAEMIAVMVDPKFKPTTFSGKSNEGGILPITTPPPVAP